MSVPGKVKDVSSGDLGLTKRDGEVGVDPSFGTCSISKELLLRVQKACKSGKEYASEPKKRKVCSDIASISALALMCCGGAH